MIDTQQAKQQLPGNRGNRCRDFDADCYGIADKFACWKYDPEQGVCPFLTGEISDP